MKTLLVVADRDVPQLRLLSALKSHYEIVIDPSPGPQIDPDAVLLWESPDGVLKRLLAESKKLTWLHTPWAGVEGLISPELRASKVEVTNAKGVFAHSLAEFALTGILYFAKDLPRMLRNQRASNWEKYAVRCLPELKLGVVGLGGIGAAIAEKAAALQMNVTAFQNRTKVEGLPKNVEVRPIAELDEMLPQFDFVSSSLPFTPQTKQFFDMDRFSRFKSSAVFINVGRGTTVDEQALISRLQSKQLGGAVLDVFEKEPLSAESLLWKMENVLLSPHTADRTATWLDETMQRFVDNALLFAEGKKLENLVDKNLGY